MNIVVAALQGLLLLVAGGGATVLAVRLAREAAPGLGRLLNTVAPVIASVGQAARKALSRRRGR